MFNVSVMYLYASPQEVVRFSLTGKIHGIKKYLDIINLRKLGKKVVNKIEKINKNILHF